MKRYTNISLSLFVIALVIIPFKARADISSDISLSCDKTELTYGESTKCYIDLGSSEKLSQWYGKITISDGLTIDSASSLNKNYQVDLNNNNIVLKAIEEAENTGLAIKPSNLIEQISKQKIIELKISANKDIESTDVKITIQTQKNCSATLIGDMDADGDVDHFDAILALKINVGNETQTDYHLAVGDFDNSKTTNSYDSLKILQLINKKFDIDQYENKGDINGDGVVDENDASNLLTIITKNDNEEINAIKDIADLNGDSFLTDDDLLIILQITKENKKFDEIPEALKGKYQCINTSQDSTKNISSISFKLKKASQDVNVSDTASNLSILLSILSIGLITIGFIIIFGTKKTKTQE